MKAGSGQHFEQSYNAQAAVEVESRLIVGQRVSQAPNDKEELVPSVAAIGQPVASVAAVLADSGFYSEAAVRGWNKPRRATQRHNRLCGAGAKGASSQRERFGAESDPGELPPEPAGRDR